MSEVHLTVHVSGHYYDIQHRSASEVMGNTIILQLPDMVPIRLVAVPGNTATRDCKYCPVYARNIPGLPEGIVLGCTRCRRSFADSYHYVSIDKILEEL